MDLGQFAAGQVALQGQLWAHGAGQDVFSEVSFGNTGFLRRGTLGSPMDVK